MKKIKISFLLLAVVFAVSSAFVTRQSSAFDPVWFTFVGNDNADAADYQKFTGEPDCPTSPAEVCAILANEQGTSGKPVQSELNGIVSDTHDFTISDFRVKYLEQ